MNQDHPAQLQMVIRGVLQKKPDQTAAYEEISREIAPGELYRRKDCHFPGPKHIESRARRYAFWFERLDANTIRLRSK